MKKKLKEITINDMVETCLKMSNQSCLNCPLYIICAKTPYELNVTYDLEKEIDL